MGLALLLGSADVFRAFLLLIVLTLVVGQNASVLCAVWCHPETGPTACEHQEPSTSSSVTGNDACPEVARAVTAFVREDVRREGSAPDALHVVVVPPFHCAQPPQSASSSDSGHRLPLATRPALLALRI